MTAGPERAASAGASWWRRNRGARRARHGRPRTREDVLAAMAETLRSGDGDPGVFTVEVSEVASSADLAQKSRKARRDTGMVGPATQQSTSNTRGGTR